MGAAFRIRGREQGRIKIERFLRDSPKAPPLREGGYLLPAHFSSSHRLCCKHLEHERMTRRRRKLLVLKKEAVVLSRAPRAFTACGHWAHVFQASALHPYTALRGWHCRCPHETEERSETQRMCQKTSCPAEPPPLLSPEADLIKPHPWAP